MTIKGKKMPENLTNNGNQRTNASITGVFLPICQYINAIILSVVLFANKDKAGTNAV